MLADYHVHTTFSNDSTYPMEEVVKRAITLGLDEICFSDHTDYGMGDNQICNFPAYFQEIRRLKALYQDQIAIKAGAEFGMQVHTVHDYEQAFAAYPFDFVILSCHQIDNQEFWNQEFQRGKTQEEVNRRYYEEIYEVMKRYTNYSVLGHLDAIKRDDPWGIYPFEKNKHIIEQILRLTIEQGKGIEVNTSNFRYHLPDLTPCRDILRLYYEMGGHLITLGSDSHCEEHLAAHFPYVIEELKKIGFTQYCTFERMKPIYYDLPDGLR